MYVRALFKIVGGSNLDEGEKYFKLTHQNWHWR